MQLFYAWFYVSRKEAGNIDHDSSGASQHGKYLSDHPVCMGLGSVRVHHGPRRSKKEYVSKRPIAELQVGVCNLRWTVSD